MKREFAALGATYEGRGQLLDEWLDLAESAFQQMPGRVRYEGRPLSVDGWLAPALVRPGGAAGGAHGGLAPGGGPTAASSSA